MKEPRTGKLNPLRGLERLGQSVWIDYIRRGMILSGELERLIDEDGVTGVTSNPSIFEKAIAGSDDYDNAIQVMALEGKNSTAMYETLAIDDIQLAADMLRPGYERLDGADGFVSLEVSPRLAHDSAGTIVEAQRLWNRVDRPNLMIKIPGTVEGLSAIRHLIAGGINVNVTLLFGLPRYRQVAEAFIAGLEERVSRRLPVRHVASVASFFLSRIDHLVDGLLDEKINAGGPAASAAVTLRGETAIASARLAYTVYRDLFGGERFRKYASRDARSQKLLWASTGVKNPAYDDLKYVEPLIGAATITTLPAELLRAYRDHGTPRALLTEDASAAHNVLERLAGLGVDLVPLTARLEKEGIAKFDGALGRVLQTIADRSGYGAGPRDVNESSRSGSRGHG